VKAEAQVCELMSCDGGRVRAGDTVHCCFPGQAWSTRGTCIGIPSCPAGTEPDKETCVSSDLDGDGIPNKLDKCPNEPEDKDGFEDADGCPDPDNDKDGILDAVDKCPNEPEDKNNYKDDDGCPDEAERLAVVAAQNRIDAAKQAEQRKQHEEDARRQQAEVAQKGVDKENEGRAGRRTLGFWLGGGGVLLGGGAVAFAVLANGTNSTIQSGGLASASDIQSTSQMGKTFNIAGVACAAAGGVLLSIAVPLVLANLSVSQPTTTGRVWLTSHGIEF